MKRSCVLILVCVVVMVGCQQPPQRLNSPPQGDTVHRSRLSEPYQTMVDNSVLADMTQLSGTGEYRLSQLAEVCKVHGGPVRYDSQITDEKLLEERVQRAEEYLAAAGCDMDKCSVRLGMAATAWTPAQQAVKAQQAGLESEGQGGQGLMPKRPQMGGYGMGGGR
jgi:hypothetical protein